MNDIEGTVNELKKLSDRNFELFMDNYPSAIESDWENSIQIGPLELFDSTLNAQVMLAKLGETAISRMMYIGFDILYPFHTPVEWYDWRENILAKKIPTSIFFSIRLRAVSEFKRMTLHAESGSWDAYCSLSESEFLVSKERYEIYFADSPTKVTRSNASSDKIESFRVNDINKELGRPSSVVIENAFFQDRISQEGSDKIDMIEKNLSIWSNTLNIAARMLKLK